MLNQKNFCQKIFGPKKCWSKNVDPKKILNSVPTLVRISRRWSGYPDFGPDPDIFGQSGPDFAQKSGFFIKIRKERLKMQNFSVLDLINF